MYAHNKPPKEKTGTHRNQGSLRMWYHGTMREETPFNGLDQVGFYFERLAADPNLLAANAAQVRQIRGELELLRSAARRLEFLTGRPGAHFDVGTLIKFFGENPITSMTPAWVLNDRACIATGRNRPYGSANLRQALESLGYERTVNAAGTFYSPRT